MRAACDLYEHPQLSYSEVWDKDAHGSSGVARVLTVFGALFIIATISTLAVVYYLGVLDARTLQTM